MKLSGKILIFVVAIIVISVSTVAFLVMMENSDYRDQVNQQRVVSSVENLSLEIEKMSEKAKYCATLLAKNNDIIVALEYVNFLTLKARLTEINADVGLSTITITDNDGNVIIRQHDPENKGDNISDQLTVQNALAGDVFGTLESGALVGLSSRAGAPIKNQRGDIIGTIVVGFTFEDTTLLESMKHDRGMEFTIYSGDKRLATTIDQKGSAAVDTLMDPEVKAAVLEKGQVSTGNFTLLGKPYIASYMPLTDNQGNIIGALASAMSQDEANTETWQTLLHAALTAAGVIVISAFILLWFVHRSIRKPMLAMVDASRALADGKLDVSIDVKKRKDEIGVLGRAFGHVVEKISGLIADIAALEETIAEGNLYKRADENVYSGEYKTLIQGYNKTVDTLVAYLNNLPIPVLVMGREYTIRFINENGAALMESTQEALIGSKCHELLCTDDCHNGQCVCSRAMIGGCQEEGETTAHLAGGAELEIRYMGIPIIKDGEVVGALEAITDLTEIKEAHREAKQQAGSLRALLGKIDEAAGLVAVSSRQVSEGSQVLSQGSTQQATAIQQLSSSILEIAQQTEQNALNSEKASAAANKTRGNTTEIDEKMKQMLSAMNDISASSSNISKIIKTIDDIAFQTNILALNAAVEAARAGIHGKGFAVVAEEVRNLAAKSAGAAKDTTELIEVSLGTVKQGTKVAAETAHTLNAVVNGIAQSAELMDQVAVASRQQSLSISQIENGIEQVSLVIQSITATAQESAAASEELSSQAVILSELVHAHKTDDFVLEEGDISRIMLPAPEGSEY